ncbi:MAG: orotidine-5'-phosphate decarboxylase [candidate division WOR-3 bacterium]
MTRICIALNTNDWKNAIKIVESLREEADMFKVGLPLYLGKGKNEVEALIRDGVKVFLDLKLSDIPSVVSLSLKEIPEVELLTLNGLGGYDMIKRAIDERPDLNIAVVTLMTSISEDWAGRIFKKGAKGVVINLCRLAAETGAWGAVVPGKMARYIRKNFKGLNLVVAGVRIKREMDDHHFATGIESLKWMRKDDVIVLGREITEDKDPLQTLKRIKRKIAG